VLAGDLPQRDDEFGVDALDFGLQIPPAVRQFLLVWVAVSAVSSSDSGSSESMLLLVGATGPAALRDLRARVSRSGTGENDDKVASACESRERPLSAASRRRRRPRRAGLRRR